MTADSARALFVQCLEEIAPDADPSTLAGDDDLRTTLDLDSMDIFNLVALISERAGIDIPDRDAGRMTTLDGAVAYLTAPAVSARPAPPPAAGA